jgi:intracellular sulfur oxidation DsrE/DsrF family protein
MSESTVPRRSFFGRLAGGIAGLAVVPVLPVVACASSSPPPPASLDEVDTWLATMKGSQKVVYDCVQAAGGPDGILYGRNFMTLSQEKLGTQDADMSVIVSFRHFATPYGYNDAIWAKYPQFASMLKAEDPTTKKPAARNVPLHDEVLGFKGASLPALQARGVQFAVCGAATSFLAGVLAGASGDAKAIEEELKANLIPGARIVPAGVVAVQRAQKAGFAYTFAG